jgi:hypothetical protein
MIHSHVVELIDERDVAAGGEVDLFGGFPPPECSVSAPNIR